MGFAIKPWALPRGGSSPLVQIDVIDKSHLFFTKGYLCLNGGPRFLFLFLFRELCSSHCHHGCRRLGNLQPWRPNNHVDPWQRGHASPSGTLVFLSCPKPTFFHLLVPLFGPFSHLPKADLLTFWFSNFGNFFCKGPKRITFYFQVLWASEFLVKVARGDHLLFPVAFWAAESPV